MKHLSIFLLGMFCFICNSLLAEGIPNNEIWYEANKKLEHTTDCYFPGLYPSAFDIPIVSHTFSDGKGIIKFNEDVKKIGFAAFASCDELASIYVPNSVEIIDGQAFYMCHTLSNIVFSNSLHIIGDDAFNGCGFSSIEIPNTVTEIGSRAFAQCHSLTDVQIPESVTNIGDGAFSSNEGLETIIVDPNNPIYDSRDNCNAIIETATNTIIAASTNTLIPKSVTAIGNEAYERRAELTSFTIPDNITVIGDRAFSECWNLEEVNIPNSVTSLGEGAFFFCESLKDIEIPNSVKGTIDEMFCYCRNLQSVTLSSGISYICGRAFTDCKNLTDLYCNAIVPPTIEDDWAFRNVPSNMTIHVPAVSIDMYENAPYWKKYEIVPIQNKNTIQVNLPADAADGQYRNMTLELVDPNRNQTFRLIVKESRNYSFNNLEENTKYRLSLKTKNGVAIVEFEEINYTTGNLNIDIEKEKMKQLCVVNAKVLTPSNEDVTSQCTINWYDYNGDFISKGQSVSEQIVGTKVKLSVALSKDLGVRYMFPAELLYDITSSDNTCTVNLEALPTTTLSGRVVDELTNSTLSNVTVTVSQTLNGKYSKLYSAKTDTNGKYRIQVYAVPSSISYVASDYITHTADIAEGFYNQEETVLETVKMKQITGTVITTSFTYRKCKTSSEETEIENFYSDLNNVAYSILNESTGKSITKFSVLYPKIVLLEDACEGDVLQLTATSKTGAFMPIETTVTIDAEQRANAAFNIVELGKIKATFAKNANSSVAATLYDGKGKLVKTFGYSDGTLTINDLSDGQYSLVTMGSSRLFNTIYDLTQLPQTGLVRLNDYVQHNVEVKSGEVTTIDIDEVPTLDESKLYYTGDNTSFTVNKSSIVAGNYLTLTGHLDFKSAYATSVSNVNLVVDLPESCQFVENSVMVGNATSSYTLDGHRITIPMVRYTDRVRFCIIPTLGGDYAPSALAQFDLDGETITQPIGSAKYTANGNTINVPSTVAKTTIPVSGTAIGASSIEIYDGDVLIGQTNTMANGSWATTCELHEPYNLSTHNIYAKVTTKAGLELVSENVECFYDKNAIEVKTVEMSFYNGWLRRNVSVLFDFEKETTSESSYMFYTATDFTFSIDLSINDTTRVRDVMLRVKTGEGKTKILPATYNEKQDKWFAIGRFGDGSSGNIPVNLSVSYLFDSDPVFDKSRAKDLVAQINMKDEANEELEEEYNAIMKAYDEQNYIYLITVLDKKLDDKGDNDLSAEDIALIEKLDNANTIEEFEYILEQDWMKLKKEISENLPFDIEEIDSDDDNLAPIPEGKYDYGDIELSCPKSIPDFLKVMGDGDVEFPKDAEGRVTIDISIPEFEGPTDVNVNPENQLTPENFNSDEDFFDWVDNTVAETHKSVTEYIDPISQLGFLAWENTVSAKYNNKINQQLKLERMYLKSWFDNKDLPMDISKPLDWDKSRACARECRRLEAEKVKSVKKIKVGGTVVSGALTALDTYTTIKDYFNEQDEWESLCGELYRLCDHDVALSIEAKAREYQELNNKKNKEVAQEKAAVAITVAAGAGLALETLGASLVVAGAGMLAGWAVSHHSDCINRDNKNRLKEIRNLIRSSSQCKPIPDEDDDDDDWHGFPGSGVNPIHDPSGFVYEGVFSNRLEGVTATAYYKENVENMYGDIHENIVKWDAAEYAQENPLFTDENGYYRWDVPQGMWQVKFEKEGYETTYSDWLPVPPPQLDVNIGMKQNVQPSVKMARAYPDAVEVEFDKYMMPELLMTDNIVVLVEGKPVSGSVTMLNEEASYEGSKEHYVSKIRFNAATPFAADEVTLIVSNFVKSYAGIRMQGNYSQTFSIEPELCAIEVPENVGVGYGESTTLTITALPASAAAGKTMRVRTSSEMIASISDETVTLDMDGKAEITVFGELPGTAGITFTVDGYDFNATTIVGVTIPEKAIEVAAPKASLASGSVVEMGTTVTLSCDTPNATIYYTTDGSCPCDETTRLEYTAPIVIDQTMIIRAIAVATDLTESEIVEFTYTVVPAVGIDEVTLDETIKVYPLPVRDKLNVTAGGKMIKSVTIVSANGSVVDKAAKPETLVTLNVSHLAPGIYFISVATEDKKYSRKIMKVE